MSESVACDTEMQHFMADLENSIQEAKAGISRVTTPQQILVRSARKACGLTQEEFAARIATPVATLRDWEQRRFAPPGGVLCLFKLIATHPELTQELAVA
jgi:putative transcriptional regulator